MFVHEIRNPGLEKASSASTTVPRIQSAPIADKCRLDRIVPISATGNVVGGEILHFHIRDDLYLERGRIDTAPCPPWAGPHLNTPTLSLSRRRPLSVSDVAELVGIIRTAARRFILTLEYLGGLSFDASGYFPTAIQPCRRSGMRICSATIGWWRPIRISCRWCRRVDRPPFCRCCIGAV